MDNKIKRPNENIYSKYGKLDDPESNLSKS